MKEKIVSNPTYDMHKMKHQECTAEAAAKKLLIATHFKNEINKLKKFLFVEKL